MSATAKKRTCVDADCFGTSKKYQAVGTHAESQEVVK